MLKRSEPTLFKLDKTINGNFIHDVQKWLRIYNRASYQDVDRHYVYAVKY